MASADSMQYEDLGNFSYYFETYEDDEQHQSYLSNAHAVSLLLHAVAFLLGVPGNAIVIWLTGFKWEKTATSLWFLNLAIADFIFVLSLPLYIAYMGMGFHWPFGKWLCKANSFIASLNMFASVLFLTAISLDRYVHLIYPVFSNKYRTLKTTLFLISMVWLSAAIIGMPAPYFRDTITLPDNFTVCYYNFHSHNITISIMRHNALTWVKFISGYLFPLLTMVVCYSLLIIQVKKRATLTSNRLFWTVVAVVVAFFVCWTPYHVFSILELFGHHDLYLHDLLRDAFPISNGFAFINSCLNPILYVLLSKKRQSRYRVPFSLLVKHTLWEVSRSGTGTDHVLHSMTLQKYESPGAETPQCGTSQ